MAASTMCDGHADGAVIGDENIASAKVEDVLLAHPYIKAGVGVPNEQRDERLTAIVVHRTGTGVCGDELRDWMRQRLRRSRTPDDIAFRAELQARSASKLIRREIVFALTRADDISAGARPVSRREVGHQ